MKEEINVLYLSSWYPSRVVPTNGNFVEKHALATALYCNVSILHVRSDKNMTTKYETTYDNSQQINALIIYFKSPNCRVSLFNAIITTYRYSKCYYNGYKTIVQKSGKPDIIHLNVIYPVGIVAYIIKHLAHIPYIVVEHWSGYTKPLWSKLPKSIKMISNLITKNAEIVLPVTKNLGENMQLLGFKGTYSAINNVVNTAIFEMRNPLTAGEKKRIIHISDIKDDHKNFSGILNAIKQLSTKRDDFVLEVITDGHQDKAIELANSLDILDNYVVFNGEKNASQIAKFLKNSAFLVMFSNYENFPCVIVEALACGVPVLSTDVGGIKEHLSPNFGMLINRGDSPALVEAMDKMLDNCYNYDSEAMRKYAIDNFSYQAVGARLNTVYNSVLKQQ